MGKNSSNIFIILIFLSGICLVGCQKAEEVYQLDEELITSAMEAALKQSLFLAEQLESLPDRLPKSIKNGKLETSSTDWWCSGFFPGTLWYIYEYTHDERIKDYAWLFTNRLYNEQYNQNTHDLGFMLYCSYGNAMRLTGTDACKNVLLTGAESLATRYNSTVGCIRSWDFNKEVWRYPVIIDNMMNLEFLMWAYKESGDEKFRKIAMNHSDVTMQNHFRADYSCYHVVSYSPETGKAEWKGTHQGMNHESAWARGQAWALYGYSMMYRETNKQTYLEHAVQLADYILDHHNMPENLIPYWDFDDPDIPNTLRDASAASVIASALIELSSFVNEDKKKKYITAAEKQIRVLASPEYTAQIGTNAGFILKHSVGYMQADSEVDAPLTYADYYYVEALLRYKKNILER